MSIALVMSSNHLNLHCALLLLSSIFPSIKFFPNVSAHHIKWPKYWSLNFSINSSNEYSGLISFGIDQFDLLAIPGPLKSLLQHHNSKASILQCSAFFGFPGGSVVKNPPAVQETQVWSLGLEDPLEKEMAIHFSILAWKIPWMEEPGRLQSMGSQMSWTWLGDYTATNSIH